MKGESIIKGKRGEYIAIGKLLEHGFTVYTPVCDVEGIDCIVRNEKGEFIKMQVKTRLLNGGYGKNFEIQAFKPDYDLFIACYYLDTGEMWIIPSLIFDKMASTKLNGHRVININPAKKEELKNYYQENGFQRLKRNNSGKWKG